MGILRTLKYINNRKASIDKEVARHLEIFEADMSMVSPHLKNGLKGLRALDLGCGQKLPTLIALSGSGCEVTGIDLDPYQPGRYFSTFMRRVREEGLSKAVSGFLRNIMVDEEIQRRLAAKFSSPVDISKLDIRVMNATKLDFPDNTFDLIMSSAVFEHIDDVPGVFNEVHRVLKPGGVASLNAHLWPSYEGGHNRDMLDAAGNPVADQVPDWDHLLEYTFKPDVYLNRLTLKDFRQLLEQSPLEIVGWHQSDPETWIEQKLTPELEAQLTAKGYTREDLLVGVLWMIVKKPES